MNYHLHYTNFVESDRDNFYLVCRSFRKILSQYKKIPLDPQSRIDSSMIAINGISGEYIDDSGDWFLIDFDLLINQSIVSTSFNDHNKPYGTFIGMILILMEIHFPDKFVYSYHGRSFIDCNTLLELYSLN